MITFPNSKDSLCTWCFFRGESHPLPMTPSRPSRPGGPSPSLQGPCEGSACALTIPIPESPPQLLSPCTENTAPHVILPRGCPPPIPPSSRPSPLLGREGCEREGKAKEGKGERWRGRRRTREGISEGGQVCVPGRSAAPLSQEKKFPQTLPGGPGSSARSPFTQGAPCWCLGLSRTRCFHGDEDSAQDHICDSLQHHSQPPGPENNLSVPDG